MLQNKNFSKSLGRERRLNDSWEFKRFFDSSEVFRLRECTLFRVSNTLGHFRLGITLKARGTSIQRNQVKRQVREAFRTHADVLGAYDYNVVIPKTKKLAYPYAQRLGACLRQEFKRIFEVK